jgi:hypothetical protein
VINDEPTEVSIELLLQMESRRCAEREWSTGAAPMINDVPNENSVKFVQIEATKSKKRPSGAPVINFEQNDDGFIQYLASLAPVSCRSFPAIKKRRSTLLRLCFTQLTLIVSSSDLGKA